MPSSSPKPSPPQPRYRHDIDGLRAVAVLLVVIYHVWLGRVSGGVDAFLMISAFFLTGSFVRRLEVGAPLAIAGQWIRTFKRLLPAAVVVITATVIAGTFVLPASSHPALWHHAWASLFYSENWALAVESVDYYADTALAGPLQHFWSLSVQGQVFLLWPLLFAIIAFVRWAFRLRSVRAVALVLFALLFAASLAYSVITTRDHQQFAYFDTGARLWEFAAGSLLAVVLPWISLPRRLSAVIGWIGLAALLACGMVLDVQGGFPGYLALWPVLSVAAIILAGTPEDRGYGPAVILETRPVLMLGRDAYALYLVHWPILVLTLVSRRGEPLGFVEGLILILASIVLARLLTWAVDAPLRRSRWANSSNPRSLLVIVVSIALVAGPLTAIQYSSAKQADEIIAESESGSAADDEREQPNPGAAVLLPGWEGEIDPDAPRRPLPQELGRQWGGLPEDCSNGELLPLPQSVELCRQTEPVDRPARTIVVIGNSHAQQWLDPLAIAAEQSDWHAVSFLYAACAFGLRDTQESDDVFHSAECRQWNEDVLDLIEEIDPDAVLTIGAATEPTDADQPQDAGEREHVLDGADESIERLRTMGVPVVLIRDNPRFTFDSYLCVEQAEDAEECEVQRSQALAERNPAEQLAGPDVFTLDMTDLICPEDTCPAVIGNVNVYMDDNHLSSLYAETMAPELQERLQQILAQIPPSRAQSPGLTTR